MNVARMLRAMAAAGLTAEQIADTFAHYDQDTTERQLAREEISRQRKSARNRRAYLRRKETAKTTESTFEATETEFETTESGGPSLPPVLPSSPLVSPLRVSPGPPSDNPPIIPQTPLFPSLPPAATKRKSAGSRCCPEDWVFSAEVWDEGRKRGLSDQRIADELQQIRLHEFKSPRSKWDSVAKAWLIRSSPPETTNGQHTRKGYQTAADRAEAAAQLRADLWMEQPGFAEELEQHLARGGTGEGGAIEPLRIGFEDPRTGVRTRGLFDA